MKKNITIHTCTQRRWGIALKAYEGLKLNFVLMPPKNPLLYPPH